MRIAFISGNREKLPDPVIPLGLLYVMQSCPQRHEKVLWDLCFEDQPRRFLAQQLSAYRPEVVALGIRNVQANDYGGAEDTLRYYRGLVEVIRQHSTLVKIVVGGGGFSVIPQQLMEALKPDFGICGEGERAFPELLEALEHHPSAIEQIGSLCRFNEAGILVSTPRNQPFLDLGGLPFPDKAHVDRRYYQYSGIDSVQTKRGCPLHCDYCTYPTIEGRKSRLRDPETVVEEMWRSLSIQPDTSHFFIVDSVFTLPVEHAKAICRRLDETGWTMPWTCYANPHNFDSELAQLMAEAGCAGLEAGSDSGSDRILQRLRKGFDTTAITRLHKLAHDAGLKDCHTFLLGTPGESLDDVKETLGFIDRLNPFSAILMIWIDEQEAVDPHLVASREALRARIRDLLREAQPHHPRWIIPPLGVHFDARFFRFLRAQGLSGPLWQYVDLADSRSGFRKQLRHRRTQTPN